MADDKAQNQHLDVALSTTVNARQGFFARLGAHFKKYWWLHLIIFIICFLVVLLPVVYVAYPRIAQSDVNKAGLNVTNLVFSNPTPESVHINQTQVLTSHASYHPVIYGFNATISLVVAGAAAIPVTSDVPIPLTHAWNGEIINVDTTIALNTSDSDAATQFSEAVLGSETFQLNFYGRPNLKEGSLPTSRVTFNKTVTMAGLNGLKGFGLEDVKINLAAPANGINMNGSVYIPNPSVITIEMGNVTFDVSVNNTYIGQSYLTDVVLAPGDNTIPLHSSINQTEVFSLVSGNTSAYPSRIIPLTISGNSSTYNGQEIPYYSQALRSNPLTTTMNVTEVLINSGYGALAAAL